MSKKKKTSRFKGKVTKSAKKKAATSYGYLAISKDTKVFSPKPGSKVLLDFIPYIVSDKKHPDYDDEDELAIVGEQWWRRPFKTHRGIGADNDTVLCLTSIGKKCPVCEQRAKMKKDGADEDDIKALRPSDRNLYIVVPLKQKKFEEEPHIFDISDFAFQEELTKELEDNPDNEIFPDLEDGRTLRVRFDKEVFAGNAWAKTGRIDFLKREEQYDEDILDDVIDLDQLIKDSCLSYKQLETKFYEMESEVDEDDDVPEDDESEPTTSRKRKGSGGTKRASKKKKKVVEDEEDEDEAPAKRSKKKSKGNKCPYGHKFGKDNEKHDDCDDCELWDDCYDAKNN